MSDFTILRLLPGGLADDAPASIPVLVQRTDHEPPTRTTLGEFAARADSREPLWLVLSSADAIMTTVTLSRKQARHLQKVLPYLLEETLLGDPASYWFSWSRPQGETWPVLAVKRESLESLRSFFAQQGLNLRGATSEASLLWDRAPLRLADSAGVLLMPDSHRALSVTPETEEAVARGLGLQTAEWTELEGDQAALQCLREALAGGRGIELLHDQLRPPRHKDDSGPSAALAAWKPLAGLAAAVLLAICVLLGVQQWRYQQAEQKALAQAEALYLELFPGDRVSAGLRRQFQARLNRLGTAGGVGGGFLTLMTPVGEVLAGFREQGVYSKRIRYDQQQGQLVLDLQAPGFEMLESIRAALGERGLTAEIATARNEGEGVKARIQVEQG